MTAVQEKARQAPDPPVFADGHVERIRVGDCTPSKMNPRIVNEKAPKFLELVKSIEASGVHVAIVVRPMPATGAKEKYEILSGERRWRASKAAKKSDVPAIVRRNITDEEAVDIVFFENFGREDLSPIEEGKAVAIMLEKHSGDVKAVAGALKWSEHAVRMRAHLKHLSKKWQKAAADEKDPASQLTAAHLERIARLPKGTQDRFYDERVGNCGDPFTTYGGGDSYQVISVQKLDDMIADYLHMISSAPWKGDADTGSLPPCATCTTRSDCALQGELFADLAQGRKNGRSAMCLNPGCWNAKMTVYLQHRQAELKEKYGGLVLLSKGRTSRAQEKALKQDLGQEVKYEWDFQSAKKADKGAVPALVVSGSGKGKVRWVKPHGSRSSGRVGSTKASGPKPLKKRREELDSKRWAQVLKELREKVERASFIPEGEEGRGVIEEDWEALVSMAVVFGTDHRNGYYAPRFWEKYHRLYAADENTLLGELWEKLRPVLADRLRSHHGVTQTPLAMIEEARRIAGFLKIDIEAMYADVSKRKGFTEPKSWANLKADGTPKNAKPAKKAKKKAFGKTTKKKAKRS